MVSQSQIHSNSGNSQGYVKAKFVPPIVKTNAMSGKAEKKNDHGANHLVPWSRINVLHVESCVEHDMEAGI